MMYLKIEKMYIKRTGVIVIDMNCKQDSVAP